MLKALHSLVVGRRRTKVLLLLGEGQTLKALHFLVVDRKKTKVILLLGEDQTPKALRSLVVDRKRTKVILLSGEDQPLKARPCLVGVQVQETIQGQAISLQVSVSARTHSSRPLQDQIRRQIYSEAWLQLEAALYSGTQEAVLLLRQHPARKRLQVNRLEALVSGHQQRRLVHHLPTH